MLLMLRVEDKKHFTLEVARGNSSSSMRDARRKRAIGSNAQLRKRRTGAARRPWRVCERAEATQLRAKSAIDGMDVEPDTEKRSRYVRANPAPAGVAFQGLCSVKHGDGNHAPYGI